MLRLIPNIITNETEYIPCFMRMSFFYDQSKNTSSIGEHFRQSYNPFCFL